MPVRYNSFRSDYCKKSYPRTLPNENDSNPHNFSHKSNLPTNFNLKSITLEDCDQAVFLEFNKRFRVAENDIPIILLDAEMTSLREQNFAQWDKNKQFLNGPFFTMLRKDSKPIYRTNPSIKKVIYAIPVTKKNGTVIEEYIYDGPLSYDLIYDFKFITNFRENSNKFEEQFRNYFRNKRNIIVCNNERFSIGPVDFNNFSQLELVNSSTMEERTYYVTTYELKLECFIRDLSNMQKRERPNTYSLSFDVKDQNMCSAISTVENIEVIKHRPTDNNPEQIS